MRASHSIDRPGVALLELVVQRPGDESQCFLAAPGRECMLRGPLGKTVLREPVPGAHMQLAHARPPTDVALRAFAQVLARKRVQAQPLAFLSRRQQRRLDQQSLQ